MPTDGEKHLVRELGFGEALSIGLGTMIGAGIFVLSAIAAERAGPGAAISYLLAGLVCFPTALIVSELSTGLPQAGGTYHLISRALGPLAGAIVGPGNWLGLTFACGFYLIGFAQYVAYFAPIPPWVTALVTGLLFTYLNYRGAKVSGSIQKIIVLLLIVILVLFAVWGLFRIDPALHRPFLPLGWAPVVANIGLIIVSFTGFEKVSTMAEEVRRPGSTLPRAILGSVIIATMLYAAILFVATGVLPFEGMADLQAPMVEAARRFMGTVGGLGISIAALLATASSANAAIMASSRINFAMGRDGLLPPWFNAIHRRFLTPYRSIVTTGIVAIVLAMSGQAAVLAEISSALFMVAYVLISVSLLVMRQAQSTRYRPAFRTPVFRWTALVGVLLPIGVILTMDLFSQAAGAGLVLLSLSWYAFWGRKHSSVRGTLTTWLTQERPLEAIISRVGRAAQRGRGEILVPVANPATARQLVSLAATLAQGHEATDVAALSIVTVPDHIALSEAEVYIEKRRAYYEGILQLAAERGAVAGVRVNTVLRAAHGVASGITGVAEARPQTRLILLGWHGPLTLGRIRTSVDKQVVRTAPCDVAIFLDRGLERTRRILVPAGGGPHARLGLRLAHSLASAEEGEVTILRLVLDPGETELHEVEAAVRRMAENELGPAAGKMNVHVRQAESVAAGIIDEAGSEPYDLIVIGASEEWFLRNWLFGAIPDVVAEQAPCSVLMVRTHEFRPISWMRRLFRSWRR